MILCLCLRIRRKSFKIHILQNLPFLIEFILKQNQQQKNYIHKSDSSLFFFDIS